MKKCYISLCDDGFVGLVMNGLESFLLPQLNRVNVRKSESTKGHEIFGHIFGLKSKKDGDIYYTVKHINIDTTTMTTNGSCQPNDEVDIIKGNCYSIFYKDKRLLGTIHTHPYRIRNKSTTPIEEKETYSSVFRPCMYKPSSSDEGVEGEIGQLDLIFTIVNASKLLNNEIKYVKDGEYCFQFSLGYLRFFLAAYVRVKPDEYLDCSRVEIEIPHILNEKKIEAYNKKLPEGIKKLMHFN